MEFVSLAVLVAVIIGFAVLFRREFRDLINGVRNDLADDWFRVCPGSRDSADEHETAFNQRPDDARNE